MSTGIFATQCIFRPSRVIEKYFQVYLLSKQRNNKARHPGGVILASSLAEKIDYRCFFLSQIKMTDGDKQWIKFPKINRAYDGKILPVAKADFLPVCQY